MRFRVATCKTKSAWSVRYAQRGVVQLNTRTAQILETQSGCWVTRTKARRWLGMSRPVLERPGSTSVITRTLNQQMNLPPGRCALPTVARLDGVVKTAAASGGLGERLLRNRVKKNEPFSKTGQRDLFVPAAGSHKIEIRDPFNRDTSTIT